MVGWGEERIGTCFVILFRWTSNFLSLMSNRWGKCLVTINHLLGLVLNGSFTSGETVQ